MRTKLGKIAKDLNVGIGTAAELLRKHNIEVADDPNIRIDENAINILTRAFSTDKSAKDQATDQATQRKEDKKIARQERAEKAAEIRKPVGPKIVGKIDLQTGRPVEKTNENPAEKVVETKPQQKTEAPVAQRPAKQNSQPKPAQDSTQEKKPEEIIQPKQEENKPKQVQKSEQKPQTQSEKKPEQKKEKQRQKPELEETGTNGVFRVKTVAEAPKIKVLGTIDLDTL
ncbi:MAG: hypothetical protein K2I08_07855, partial [Muribaculaceae bacterium]|nr:hypothetical protein [Muribaculaceae bacterium]